MRVDQLWSWIYVRGVTTSTPCPTSPRSCAPTLAQRYSLARPEIVTEQVSVDGTRKWLLRLAGARARGTAARDRDRLHPRGRPRHAVHLEPGRLHAHLHVLPYRHAAARAQPDGAGDRRADPAGARPHRRLARSRSAAGRRASPADGRAQDHQHRADGHGRAALQFRQRAATRWPSPPTATGSRSPSAASRSRPRGVVPEIARWGAEAGTMLAISLHAVRDELRDELVPINRKYPIAELMARLPRLSGPVQRAPHHLRVRDAEGRQRQPGGGHARWCGCWPASRRRST